MPYIRGRIRKNKIFLEILRKRDVRNQRRAESKLQRVLKVKSINYGFAEISGRSPRKVLRTGGAVPTKMGHASAFHGRDVARVDTSLLGLKNASQNLSGSRFRQRCHELQR